MTAALTLAVALTLAWTDSTPGDHIDGKATYMNPGKIEQAARNTHRSLDGVIGGVAMNRRGDIGRLVWLEHKGRITGPYRVVDCAQQGEHYETRERQNRILEVTYELADEWGMIGLGPTDVTVWLNQPAPPARIYTREAY